MVTANALSKVAQDRLEDSKVLLKKSRYTGSVYMAGYAIELKLKSKITQCLNIKFPSSVSQARKEGQYHLMTHDLEELLKLSGEENKIKSNYLAEWSFILNWSPELRYATKNETSDSAKNMQIAVKMIIANI